MNFFNKHFKKNTNSNYDDYNNEGGYYEDNMGYAADDGTGYADDYTEDTSAGAAFEMKIITPTDYSDRENIAKCLVNGNAVFLNIENVDKASIIRLMDYLSGVIYVIEGKVKWSNSSSIIFAPKNVNISGLEDEEAPATEETENIAVPEEEAAENYYG